MQTERWVRFGLTVLVFSALAAAAEADEIVIQRDGRRSQGSLTGCSEDACTLNGARVPRSDIAWIGFDSQRQPPTSGRAEKDEIHLKDGRILRGSVGRISRGAIGLEGDDSIDRDVATWVHFAGPELAKPTPAPSPPGGGIGTSPPPARTPSGPRTPPPGTGAPPPRLPPTPALPTERTPPSPPSRRPGETVKPCPPDKPLGGHIEQEITSAREQHYSCRGSARLWFRLHAEDQNWPYAIGTVHHADAITYELRNAGCTDMPDPRGEVCTAPALQKSGRVVIGPVGRFGVVDHDPGRLTGVSFDPLEPSLSFSLGEGIKQALNVNLTCVGRTSQGVLGVQTLLTTHGQVFTRLCEEQEFVFCVDPTPCYSAPGGAPLPDCAGHPDRYAAIPFAGSRRRNFVTGGYSDTHGLQWEVCCGCGEPPSGPAPTVGTQPEGDDCDKLKRLISQLRQLTETYQLFERDFKEAERKRDQARDSIWGPGGALQKYFTSMLSLAGKGASAALQKAIGLAKTLIGMSGQGNFKDIQSALKAVGWGPQDLLLKGASKAAVDAAVQRANEYLVQTGDHQGALRLYAESIGRSERLASAAKTVTKGLSFVTGAKDYADKTSALADLVQNWLEYDGDAKVNQAGMDDVQERMRDLQLEIDEARRRCRQDSRLPTRGTVRLAKYVATAAQSAPGPPAAAGQGDLPSRLRATSPRLVQIPDQLEAAVPWLLPFIFGSLDGTDARLRGALLERAVPHLESVRQTLDDAVSEGQQTQSELERSIPKSKQAPPQPTRTKSLRSEEGHERSGFAAMTGAR